MTQRWILATVAAIGLAFVVINGTMPVGLTVTGEAAAVVCDANPKPANLNFTLKDVNGASVNLAAFKGKVIVLDFWATWCAPCKVEIPGFVELYAKYKSRGLVILGLSVEDTVEQLRPFVVQYKMNYPVLLGLEQDKMLAAYDAEVSVPVTWPGRLQTHAFPPVRPPRSFALCP
jgi:peroxiredoxin